MKIRSGFVSNSSSASFTIVWKVWPFLDHEYAKDVGEITAETAINNLLEFEEPGIAKRVVKATHQIAPNIFESCFSAIMMNCFGDLGKDAQALLFALYLDQHHPTWGYRYAEIISTNLESQNAK